VVVFGAASASAWKRGRRRGTNSQLCAGSKKSSLTTPDLVLLSLLAERAMHGYEANLELEPALHSRLAAISRPQVYYSLRSLPRPAFIRKMQSSEPGRRPGERTVFETTHAGRAARPMRWSAKTGTNHGIIRCSRLDCTFLARTPRCFREQLERRRKFVEHELVREKGDVARHFEGGRPCAS